MAGNLAKPSSREELWELIRNLPAERLIEVRKFVEFLHFSQNRAVEQVGTPEQNSHTPGWLPGFFDNVIGGWQEKIKVNDSMIAIIAKANKLTLVMSKSGRFSRVDDLQMEDWEA